MFDQNPLPGFRMISERRFALAGIAAGVCLGLWVCGGGEGVQVFASEGKALSEQREEAARFIPIRAEPSEIRYVGWLRDNSGGFVPGPSDWEFLGYLRVSEGDEAAWCDESQGSPDVPRGYDWGPLLTNAGVVDESPRWCEDGNLAVGVVPGAVVFRSATQ